LPDKAFLPLRNLFIQEQVTPAIFIPAIFPICVLPSRDISSPKAKAINRKSTGQKFRGVEAKALFLLTKIRESKRQVTEA
jgi:hypothetical protein